MKDGCHDKYFTNWVVIKCVFERNNYKINETLNYNVLKLLIDPELSCMAYDEVEKLLIDNNNNKILFAVIRESLNNVNKLITEIQQNNELKKGTDQENFFCSIEAFYSLFFENLKNTLIESEVTRETARQEKDLIDILNHQLN